jgi:hypothetical protein
MNYADIKSGLDQLALKISNEKARIVRGRLELTKAQTELAALPAASAELRTAIDDAATANPTDEAYIMQKNEKDKLVANFQALKTYCDNLIAAYDAVIE